MTQIICSYHKPAKSLKLDILRNQGQDDIDVSFIHTHIELYAL